MYLDQVMYVNYWQTCTFNRFFRFYHKKSGKCNLILWYHIDARIRGLFRISRNDDAVQQIANAISKGKKSIDKMLDDFTVREIAHGLQYFLLHLRKPLIPIHIQTLALGNVKICFMIDIFIWLADDNHGIDPEVIAHDVLGLVREELSDRHEKLVLTILDMLFHIVKNSPADELAGYSIPVSMLPVFFHLQASFN